MRGGGYVPSGFKLLLKAEHSSFLPVFAEAEATQHLTGSGIVFSMVLENTRIEVSGGKCLVFKLPFVPQVHFSFTLISHYKKK